VYLLATATLQISTRLALTSKRRGGSQPSSNLRGSLRVSTEELVTVQAFAVMEANDLEDARYSETLKSLVDAH
jgi:hypothetical protein